MNAHMLKHGVPVRLFPVVPESCKEQKSLSIVLATMISVKPFAERVLAPLGVKVRKRTTINCHTEVTLTNELKNIKDRPDALLVVDFGKTSWSALVEAKVGKHVVEPEQLERYIELAKANNVDAVITVSNELTASPDINPTQLPKTLPKNVSLYHLSWASILTSAFLLAASKDDPYENDDEAFIISELIRYLEHPNSGLVPLDQMNRDWPQIVGSVQAGHPISAKSAAISEMITTWRQESRDVALIMTRKLKEAASIVSSRSNLNNPSAWNEMEAKKFVQDKILSFDLDVPNAASRIRVEADFLRRAVRVSMKLSAPTDRASNSARVNWLLKQLPANKREKVILTCITRGKGQNYGRMANEIDSKSDKIKQLAEIVSFEVEMSSDLGAKFNSRKKFIEALESLVPVFYQNVGQHLQAFVPPPPKLEKQDKADQEVEVTSEDAPHASNDDNNDGQAPTIAEKTDAVRPSWASHWQTVQGDEGAQNSDA